MSEALDRLAARYGITVSYKGLDGVAHEVPDTTKVAILAAMGVDAGTDAAVALSLLRAPEPQELARDAGARCFMPEWLEEGRGWGISLQLYALRSARNWGIGDFADLAAFAATAAAAGADFIGINPLHAGFLAEPQRRSPFFPSSRRYLNPLYIAPDMVPGFDGAAASAEALAAARSRDLVDYKEVAALKLPALRRLWPAWRAARDLPAAAYAHVAFAAFAAAEGEPVQRHGLFEALSLAMVAEGHGSGWESWPPSLRSADTPEVKRFAVEHADEIAFHIWLQWLANVQLTEARDAARAHGLRLGLYLDLAVGEAPDGSATWGDPALTMRGVHVGAPPDYFSATGQDWALAPLSPAALLERDAQSYRDLISVSMRHAGALRIDHAMSIRQLFLVPRGRSPAEGAYVRYPTAAILRALAATSWAHRTVVIGEDLGYVPEGFRETMAEARMLSYRILYFERDGSGFMPTANYPPDALACLSTHDLPTLEGWWRGEDIQLRRDHDLIDQQAAEAQLPQRALEREQLAGMLVEAGLLAPAAAEAAIVAASDPEASLPSELAVAIHRLLAQSPSRLLAVRLEDLVGQRRPVNLPGTTDSYPNWQHRLALPIEGIGDTPRFRAITAAVAAERPRP